MRQSTYWRRFYRRFNWDQAYLNRTRRMAKLVNMNAPKAMVAAEARMVLESIHRGRWLTVWAVFTDACWAHYAERYQDEWEWIRTRIFRRAPDPDIAEIEREMAEDAALNEMAKSL